MPPTLLVDLTKIDLDRVAYDVDAIEAVNPHRGHMRMLDGVVHLDEQDRTMVAFKDIRDDEFWVEGHIPGRPIFPGVLMIEAAAQLASFVMIKVFGFEFVGFAGVDNVKFRLPAVPGDRLYILGKELELRKRRSICAMQGMVNGKLCFEATVTGMPM